MNLGQIAASCNFAKLLLCALDALPSSNRNKPLSFPHLQTLLLLLWCHPHFLNWTNASDSWFVSCPASPASATCLHSVARVRHPSNTQIWSSYPVPLYPHTTRKAPTGYAPYYLQNKLYRLFHGLQHFSYSDPCRPVLPVSTPHAYRFFIYPIVSNHSPPFESQSLSLSFTCDIYTVGLPVCNILLLFISLASFCLISQAWIQVVPSLCSFLISQVDWCSDNYTSIAVCMYSFGHLSCCIFIILTSPLGF